MALSSTVAGSKYLENSGYLKEIIDKIENPDVSVRYKEIFMDYLS